MPRGRDRPAKPAGTVLASGAVQPANWAADAGKANTGKSGAQNKHRIYRHPLPLPFVPPEDAREFADRDAKFRARASKAHGKNAKRKEISWSQWATSFLPSWLAPAEQPLKATGHYDPLTCSVWVTNPTHAQLLWQRGFFGKGSLSRSEPTWHERRVHTLTILEQRKRETAAGINRQQSLLTAEELTAIRRKERLAAKIERAKAAVRAGTQLPDGIIALGAEVEDDEELKGILEKADQEDAYRTHVPGLIYFREPALSKEEKVVVEEKAEEVQLDEEPIEIELEEVEYVQLSMVEALFLSAMLGVLEVCDEGQVLDGAALYQRCLQPVVPSISPAVTFCRPDNPFFLNYISYHHYRSLGWVVKPGTKFCIDHLLYKKGPVFGHAEFAILVVPSYEVEKDKESSPFPRTFDDPMDWVRFHSVNRVNTQVMKTLILCHVFVPSVERCREEGLLDSAEALVQGLKSGRSFAVKDVAVRRWVPARMKP